MAALVFSKDAKRRLLRQLHDCRWPDCKATSTHGLPGGWRPFYCTAHAAAFPALVPTAVPTCSACDAPAVLGVTDKDPPTTCCEHADDSTRTPALNLCAGCGKRASYGPQTVPRGESFACVCASHGKSVSGFWDVVSPACVECAKAGELTVPWFGPTDGKSKRQRCAKHALPSDVDHCKTPKCIVCAAAGVDTDASYCAVDEPDAKKANAKFCREHRPGPTAVSVANYKCGTCGVFAVNAAADTCAQCTKKLPEVHRRTTTRDGEARGAPMTAFAAGAPSKIDDARSRGERIGHADGTGYACHALGCPTHAFYGCDGVPTHCAVHAGPGARVLGGVSPCLTCKSLGATKSATWTVVLGRRPTRCAEHKETGMVDTHLRHKCIICLDTHVRAATDVCFECRKELPRTKSAETAVAEALATGGLDGVTLALRDRPVPCRPKGSPAFRPDFCWALDDRVVVLEVDENAHRFYEPVCEVGRLHQLHESFAPRPLLVLRYNPHAPCASHASVPLHVRALFVRGLPDTGLHVEYVGYKREHIADLDAAAHDMHVAAEDAAVAGAGAKRARVDDDDDESAGAGGGGAAGGAGGAGDKRVRLA